ncbi:hypothetical protein DER46DRAFT_569442 [Fusarium sp. MPI-SDFR-AT-0072]|nr:hypothetical protein DER46DRAFT_569442 [Fusarium sp. MPI-SDFR-AT-0072]
MWQVVPGDPEVRRERVRPGEWDLEKEAEKPGQRVWSKIMETSGDNDGVVWGYTEGRTSGSRGRSRSRTVKHRGSRRLTPGDERARSEEQGLFGNDVCQKSHLSIPGPGQIGTGFAQGSWWRIGKDRAGVRSAQVDSGQERFDLSREHSSVKEKRIQSVRESSWPTNGPTEALFSALETGMSRAGKKPPRLKDREHAAPPYCVKDATQAVKTRS